MKAASYSRVAAIFAVAVMALFLLSFLSPITNASPLHAPGATASASAPAASVVKAPATHTAAPSSHAASPTAAKPAAGAGPHPGTLDIYEVAPGGAITVDPSVAYYTVDYEPILNAYQTLIAYNQSLARPDFGSYVPQLATCVPGSGQCLAQFGSTMVFNNLTTNNPQYYSFEIDAGAHFYDPATHQSWPVYPSDVVFSLDRTMSFANLPAFGVYNGWINTQDLLPAGNPAYDGGIHAPYNNTPNHVLSAILVNNSLYCPTPQAGLAVNGCVTFNVGASGKAWPFFLELVADALGAGVAPCGVFTSLGAGLPGWAGSAAKGGDGPCLLPGGATSTSDASFTSYVSSVSPTSWDAAQQLAVSNYPSPNPSVQFNMIGSGPYYQVSMSNSVGYSLQANPAYNAPVGCAGTPGCEPVAGKYAPTVNVYWDNSDTLGLQELIAGQADTAGFDISHVSTVLQLVSQGTYGLERNIPTLSVYWNPFELNFSVAAEKAIDPVGKLNVPGDFLSNVGLRTFINEAYPYTTVQNTIWTVDGVSVSENYGGAIPRGMGNYYPTNVSWPSVDPVSNPGTPGNISWWWNELTTVGSPWYDSELAACSSATPCYFPTISLQGVPSLDNAWDDWDSEIATFSHNALQPYRFDLNGGIQGSYLGLAPGSGNMPIYSFGWAPDYPDPTDYTVPAYQPDGTYTYTDAVAETLNQAAFNSGTCGHTGVSTWANFTYWANIGQLPNACQGVAYHVMNAWINASAHLTDLTQRTLNYNLIEHIANELSLYTWFSQFVGNDLYGSWIDPSTINQNVMIGGGADQLWYAWGYASNSFNVYFNETGLPASTSWSVTLAGVTSSTTAASLVIGEHNGTFPYTVGYVPGYTVAPGQGNVTVAGAKVVVTLTFTAIVGVTQAVTVTDPGVVTGTLWSVDVNGVGSQAGNATSFVYNLPAGKYYFTPGIVVGYTTVNNASSPGNFTVALAALAVPITYTGVLFSTYAVAFESTGLPGGQSWSVTFGTYTISSTAANITFYAQSGTYKVAIAPPAGVVVPATSGQVAVNAANTVVSVPMVATASAYALTFMESGLPASSPWNVTIGGLGVQSTTTTVVFMEGSGTYNWTVSTIGGYTTSAWSGTVKVSGAPASVTVTFTQFTYPVTFFEGGLPVGATWNVTIGGVTLSSTVATGVFSIVFPVPNGTAAYTITGPMGYTPTPATGSVVVAAGPNSQVIVFGISPTTYAVQFTASGLPSGDSWTVTLNGVPQTGTGALSFSVPNGNYTFSVSVPSGLAATPGSGSLSVSGAGVSLKVSVAPPVSTTTNGNGISTLGYALIGIFVLLTIVFLVTTILYARRKPPASTPPQTWSAGGQTGGSSGGDMKGGDGQSPPPSS